ncbi:hypothetical protein VI06_11645 [Aquitalea magnusonii]|nr:hypothetical protein VI06_11645 [Aquitalea magnusonii]
MRYVIGMAFFIWAPFVLLGALIVAFTPQYYAFDFLHVLALFVSPFLFLACIRGYGYCTRKLERMA